MLYRLIKYRPDLASSTIVVSLSDDGKMGLALKKMGVTVISLRMNRWFSSFSAIFRLFRIIRSERPNVVHTWMYHANLLGGIASIIAGNKNIIWSIRRADLSIGESVPTFLIMKIGALLSKTIPQAIVCVAESGMKNHKKYGYDATKMIVIPNGYDVRGRKPKESERKKIRERFNIADDEIVIGTVGRFHASKDYGNFVTSSSIISSHYKKVRFFMIGRGVDRSNSILVGWINKMDCADKFYLFGEINDVPAHMSAMDIFCLSSKTEGFPNVVAEAMSMSLPCVVTDVGDVKRIVGEAAIIVEPGNSTALSIGLSEMLSQSAECRKDIGLKASNRIKKEYPLSATCEKYDRLYFSLSG